MIVHTMNFKIAGITLPNKDGKDPQEEIKRILKDYKRTGYIDENDLYEGYTNREIKEDDIEVSEYKNMHFPVKLKQAKFENDDCIEVYFVEDNKQETHIGYVPKNLVKECIEWLSKENIETTMSLKITGGKVKMVEEEEKSNGDYAEKVVTDERNYGGVIGISFFDKTQPTNNTQSNIVKEIKMKPEDNIKIAIIIVCVSILLLIIILANTYIQTGSFNILVNNINETIN